MSALSIRTILCCLFLLPAAARVLAGDESTLPDVSLSGFGTLGVVHNSTGGAEFTRDLLQPRGVADGWSGRVDSRLGVQLDVAFNDRFDVVVQALSKYTDEGNFTPELTWAFLRYEPNPDLRLRAGRLGWDVYLLADSRDVGYSYPWVRPPVDYFSKLLLSHLDGADMVYRREIAGGLASLKVYGGLADQEVPTGPGLELDITGSVIVGGNIDFRRGDWLFRVGYSNVEIDGELPNHLPFLAALRGTGVPSALELADDLSFDGHSIDIISAGGAWEHGPWQAQLMYNHLDSGSLTLTPTNSAYFLLAYRRGRWSPYFTASGTLTSKPDRTTGLPLPNPLDSALNVVIDNTQATQHTISAGLRYDFMPNADVKLQVDRIHVYDHQTGLWRDPRPDWDGDATLFTLTLDFVF